MLAATRPNGHLPFAVEAAEQTRQHFDERTTRATCEAAAVVAAMPEVIHKVVREVMPDKYTPESADAIAADVVAELTWPRPLTAAQRGGPAWRARYGCPGDWCDMRHDGDDGEPGWHQGRTIAVTAPSSCFDQPGSSGPESTVIAARINQVTQDADAYGLKTEIWLDVDLETLQLTPQQARDLFTGLKRVMPQLDAMCDEAERLSEGDHPGDPEVRARKDAEMDAHIKARNEGRFCGCVRCVAAVAEQA
jgi:hypothetical protein